MPQLDAARWIQLAPRVDELLTLSAAERERWLDELAVNDPETASQLRSLMQARDAASSDSFLGGAADQSILPASVCAGDVLGGWTLVDVIGEGGMGSVWRARRSDGRFEGEAAIKLLRTGLFDRGAQERFRREGAILAKLRHPGIAQLLDAGITALGQPYLVLELVQGERIDHWCQSRQLGVRERVALFTQVLDAVAAAHGQLVIHRDLKPSNILVDDTGRARLLDFGIARLQSDEVSALTREGAFALTPEYAAPEQFEAGALSMATDVYALGVVLYELLTGAHPSGLCGAAPLAYLRAATQGVFKPASEQAPAQAKMLRGDLDNILAKALRNVAAERYASVAALADDLRRYLRDEPVAAHAPDWRYRTGKLIKRRPWEAGLGLVLVVAIVVGMAATLWQWQRAEQQRATAERSLARAWAANEFNASLLTEVANLNRPLSFNEILARGEKLAGAAGTDSRQQAYALIVLAQYHSTDGDLETTAKQAAQAVAAARKGGDPALAAMAQCIQGMAIAYSGDPQGGEKMAAQASADPSLDREGKVTCLNQLGLIALQMRDGAKALQANQQALALMLASPLHSPSQLSTMHHDIGEAHRLLGNYTEAIREYREALAILQSMGLGESSDAASILNQWSVLEADTGQTLAAIERGRQAIRIEESVLGSEGVSAAKTLNLARNLIQTNRLDEAWQLAQRSLDRAGHGGNGPAQILGEQTLATIRRLQGRYAEANQHLDAAFALLKGMPLHSPIGIALQVNRAQIERAQGRPQEALDLLAAAKGHLETLTQKVGGRDHLESPWLLWLDEEAGTLGDAGRAGEGLPLAREGLAIARHMQHGAPASGDTGRMLLTLSALEVASSGPAQAASTAKEALANLLPTVGPDSWRTRKARAIAGVSGA